MLKDLIDFLKKRFELIIKKSILYFAILIIGPEYNLQKILLISLQKLF